MKPNPVDPARRAKPQDDGRGAPPGDLPDSEVDLSSPGESSSPQMPHERDETAGMTGGVPSERVRQAARDLADGRRDTSRATESDRAYHDQVQTGPTDPSGQPPRR